MGIAKTVKTNEESKLKRLYWRKGILAHNASHLQGRLDWPTNLCNSKLQPNNTWAEW